MSKIIITEFEPVFNIKAVYPVEICAYCRGSLDTPSILTKSDSDIKVLKSNQDVYYHVECKKIFMTNNKPTNKKDYNNEVEDEDDD